MAEFVAICAASDIPNGEGKAFTHGSHRIAVFNIDGNYYAISDACPHAGGPLSEGWLDGTEVTCPWHGWSFDVKPCAGNGSDGLCRYAVRLEGDTVKVEIPD